MRLIFNADDFGLTEGVNLGILKAFKSGVVKSTTLMVNMPFVREAVEISKNNPDLGVGVHLTATAGEPIIKENNSLVDENGKFHNKDFLYDYTIELDLEELYIEWKAQIEKFIELLGYKPTHLDSHHHIHIMPRYLEVVVKLAEEYNIPMREKVWSNKKYEYVKLDQDFIYDRCSIEYFINNQDKFLSEDVVEIMCHPGYIDKELIDFSSYSIERCNELNILVSKNLKKWISDNKIELINYKNVKKL